MKPPAPMPSDRITVTHLQNWREGIWEYENKIEQDYHLLRLPLSCSKVTITTRGRTLHDGAAFPGMLRLVSPGEPERLVMHTRVEAMVLRVPGPVLRSVVAAAGGKHRPGQLCFVNGIYRPNFQIEQLGRSLLQIEELDPAHARLYVDGVTHALLGCLLYHHASGTGAAVRAGGLTKAAFQQAADYAAANMEQPLTLESWAAVLGMMPAEFTRRFRATAGCSPYAWFMSQRIERAKELLCDTQQSLGEIAFAVGFCSQSHFTEAFRRRAGVPPARWREKCKRRSG